MVMVIHVNGHELEFDKKLIDTFEREVPDSFEKMIPFYLLSDFEEESLDEIFANHSKQELIDAIINASKEEIALYKGML